MGLFGPFWSTKDEMKVPGIVARIRNDVQDPKVLKRIAMESSFPMIRDEAVLKIDDQQTLFSVLNESDYDDVRVIALSRIVAQDREFETTPYNDLIESLIREHYYSKAHSAAINLSNDLVLI